MDSKCDPDFARRADGSEGTAPTDSYDAYVCDCALVACEGKQHFLFFIKDLDEDPKDRFHFECRECIYWHIFKEQDLMKLGAMFCHSDIINFGNLPYTDFRRSKTLCQGGDCCDFDFVRHNTDAGDGWERTKSM